MSVVGEKVLAPVSVLAVLVYTPLVTVAAFPLMLPAIVPVTVRFASVPTEVSDEAVTLLARVVPVIPLAGTAVAVIVPEPLVPSEPPVPIVSAVAFVPVVTPLNATFAADVAEVAVVAFPFKAPEKVVAVSTLPKGLYVSPEYASAPRLPLVAFTKSG
jgi:hypothetical protein